MQQEKQKPELPEYEQDTWLRHQVYRFIVQPVLNRLPSSSQNLVQNTHRFAHEVIEQRTTHSALEVMYRGSYKGEHRSLLKRFFYHVWMNTDNARGVRNRLKLTEYLIEKKVRKVLEERPGDVVRICSIASGSARSIITVLNRVKNNLEPEVSFNIVFLDKSPDALEYSKKMVLENNFSEQFQFEWVEGTVNNFLQKEPGKEYDVVEMVGLLDYFNNDKVCSTVDRIYDVLRAGGSLVTANILPNPEQRFVANVMDWHMFYRTCEEFLHLMQKTRFDAGENISSFSEPMSVHVVVQATKI